MIRLWRTYNMAAAVGIVFPIVPTHHQYVNLLCRVHLVNTVYPAAAAEAYTVADDIREDTCRVISTVSGRI